MSDRYTMNDRWLEVDLDWFYLEEPEESVHEFAKRVAPLLGSGEAERGVILNVGWITDVVFLWSGDAAQKLPLEAKRWSRLAQLSYENLRECVAWLKSALSEAGVSNPKIGIMVVGWGEFVLPEDTGAYYDITSEWRRRHPELYAVRVTEIPGADLDPRVPLTADNHRYARYPEGIPAGEFVGEVLGKQWAALSEFLGVEVLHLRDGWFGPLIYRRRGYYGTEASPDPSENQSWTDAVISVARAVKKYSPDTILFFYSSAVGGNVEHLIGCVDLEQVVACGMVDAFIDQTWGGAWQDWWPSQTLAWSFQLNNLLSHAVVLRDDSVGSTKHIPLIETWDGWEPWDTLHRTPNKLEWAIWAFAHAGVLTPEGVKLADGFYISWMNNPHGELLSEPDVRWLADAVSEAVDSAKKVTSLHGLRPVHNRAALERVVSQHPTENMQMVWEDHLAMTSKFGSPVGPVTKSEWLSSLPPGCYLWPAVQENQVNDLEKITQEGSGVILTGRSDITADRALNMAGVTKENGWRDEQFGVYDNRQGRPGGWNVVHLPLRPRVRADGDSLFSLRDEEALLVRKGSVAWWQTPEASEPEGQGVDVIRWGAFDIWDDVSQLANRLVGELGEPSLSPRALHETVIFQSWETEDRLVLLLGNIESGIVGDARFERHVRVNIPGGPLSEASINARRGEVTGRGREGEVNWIDVTVGPENFALIEMSR